MRWQGGRQSENVEDRRGMPRGAVIAGGGLGTIILLLIVMALGGDPQQLLQQVNQGQPQQQQGGGELQLSPEEERLTEFVKTIVGSTEDVWTELFREQGLRYRNPTLVLFRGSTESGCGFASAAIGPFYCPVDEKVYLDLGFYKELSDRFGAPGEFAQAYVIAHEIGHHVQKQLGTTDQVHSRKGRVSEREYNQLSVRLELQADYFAGVWAHHAQLKKRDLLDARDIREGLNAAKAIGDDNIQRQSQGYVVPDAFTHGSSEQRERWFRLGMQTGDMSRGDTFDTNDL